MGKGLGYVLDVPADVDIRVGGIAQYPLPIDDEGASEADTHVIHDCSIGVCGLHGVVAQQRIIQFSDSAILPGLLRPDPLREVMLRRAPNDLAT